MTTCSERVLVTGGTGFIGAALVRALIRGGKEVHLLIRRGADLSRLAGLEGRYRSHRGDLLHLESVSHAVHAAKPHVIYHLAADNPKPPTTPAVAACGPAPRSMEETHRQTTANLLHALKDCAYRALIHAGSGVEYGPWDRAIPEDAALDPRHEYARAKAAASRLCHDEMARGRPVAIVRIFAAYGPGEGSYRLVPYVMDSCLRNEPPRLSAGWQRRDWIHVDDVVSLLCRASEPPALGRVLHAGTGSAHSVRDAVHTVLELSGRSKLEPVFAAEPLRPHDSPLYLAGVEQTRQLTGWQSRYDLRSGLEQTWRWFVQSTCSRTLQGAATAG